MNPFPAVTVLCMLPTASVTAGDHPLIPVIDGDWWAVAGNPDLGPLTDPRQQPVDFALWQAADGSWQLWSCIRHTRCGGHTRLFYRWEGQKLTDENWTPKGIALQADTDLGEQPGGLQAPHVIRVGGEYKMLYGDWERICLAASADGKDFSRVLGPDGQPGLFTEGRGANTRDPMVLPVGDTFHCYYTAYPGRKGAVYCRTSPDLRHWSASKRVAFGGSAGTGPCSAECPHVVRHQPSGAYYLFRTQKYGRSAQTSVYRSEDPLDFGIEDDRCLVCRLPVAAPEIIRHDGRWFIAALLPSLQGIRIARLKWEPRPSRGRSLFDFDDPEVRDAWRLVEGEIDPLFTTSTRHFFNPPHTHFIGTAESVRGGPDDAQQGIIESPPFTLEADHYLLAVSGGADAEHVYVALIEAESGEELARFTGTESNTFQHLAADATAHRGTRVRLRIVDRSTKGWGHINFGGIFIAE